MFDAALASPGPSPVAAATRVGPAIHPAALAGALALHLAGFGLLAWAASSREPMRREEAPAIELTLETVAAEAPASEALPAEPPPLEAPPPEPPPEPEAEPPPVIEPPPREPPPPVRAESAAPPAAPRPRPPPPRERRAPAAASSAAPSSAAPPAAAPAAPAPAAGPPVVTNPRFRRPPAPPDYPLVARERGVTGTAIIRALVGADGETRDLRLHRSSGHEILDNAALAAVRRWSFEPSSRDGVRIEAWIEVPIRFQLR